MQADVTAESLLNLEEYLRDIQFFVRQIDRLDKIGIKMVSGYISAQAVSTFLCLRCDKEFESRVYYITNGWSLCPFCTKHVKSKAQDDLVSFICDIKDIQITVNSRSIIHPYELDIYLPEYNIAIEYNGLYWHSEDNIQDKNYHLNKLLLCEKKGIRLIQIFEDEWLYRQHIVKSRIKHILGKNKEVSLGARECYIKEINVSDKK